MNQDMKYNDEELAKVLSTLDQLGETEQKEAGESLEL